MDEEHRLPISGKQVAWYWLFCFIHGLIGREHKLLKQTFIGRTLVMERAGEIETELLKLWIPWIHVKYVCIGLLGLYKLPSKLVFVNKILHWCRFLSIDLIMYFSKNTVFNIRDFMRELIGMSKTRNGSKDAVLSLLICLPYFSRKNVSDNLVKYIANKCI